MSEQQAPATLDTTRTSRITFYGTAWCGDCHRSRRLLDRLDVPYRYVDVAADRDGAEWVRAHSRGHESVPTIELGTGGPILVEPSDRELQAALSEAGYLVIGQGETATNVNY